ncbi:heavy-metal-associated domain-containing protein [Myroides ceti]|uniref:Heavy-metal-associated domain-containing protein n=1 Tax=Paenimyroides ceti TaxID=395087 RepID=A0ABT8CY17_9FLAO|nr:heavy-metal-associated domain-containing protein [Paenimyroides ceti]MDN3708518.1 heavy-metal-associated domain-containing protein [Paenimyroides ceti]MDN3708862.1 heavy-metal-associated domain-containing protein [Paenimyroides ceti]
MEQKDIKFKTNINCSSCVAKVTPFLDAVKSISHWEVDTKNREKILTLRSDGANEKEIIESVQKAGFKIEPLISCNS